MRHKFPEIQTDIEVKNTQRKIRGKKKIQRARESRGQCQWKRRQAKCADGVKKIARAASAALTARPQQRMKMDGMPTAEEILAVLRWTDTNIRVCEILLSS